MRTLFFFAAFYFGFWLAGYAVAADIDFDRNGVKEKYTADLDRGILKIERDNHIFSFDGVVGVDGGVYRSLVMFNDTPSLYYSNTSSSTTFDVYYTLEYVQKNPHIGCLYSKIKNSRNGILIKKAVCGLDLEVTSQYQNFVFKYSDGWITDTNLVSVEALVGEPVSPVDVAVGVLGGIEIRNRYESLDDLLSGKPSTLAVQKGGQFDFGKVETYLVYAADGVTVVRLDVVVKSENEIFKSYSAEDLSELITR